MIKEHTLSIANYLMTALPWLRDISVLTRKYEGGIRVSTMGDDGNYGVDDRRGNHAYMRYTGNTQDIVFTKPARPINERARIASCDLTLVCVFKADDPEAVAWSLAALIASCPLTGQAKTEIQSTDADRYDILMDEIGSDSEVWKAARVRFNLSWPQNFAVCPNPTPLSVMDRCCSQTIDLGCVNSCEDLDSQFALAAGQKTLDYIFEGASRIVTIAHPGGMLMIPTVGLNESYVYTLKVYDGATTDTPVNFTRDGVTTKCLTFKINPTV